MAKDMFGDEVGGPSPPATGRQPASGSSWTQPDSAPPTRPSSSAREGWLEGNQDSNVILHGSGARTSPIGPPVYLLGAAGTCVAVSLLLGLIGHSKPGFALGGWVLGGFAAIGFLALFTLRDAVRRVDAWYTENTAAAKLRASLVVLAVAVVALNAYQFADWAARR